MALFDDAWMKGFQEKWNAEADLAGALEKIEFNSVIGYGFPNEDTCRGFINVENGQVTESGEYDGRTLSWDMRAEEKNWEKWLKKGIGMTGLGLAFTTGKMKFKTGDFKAMISDPRMAGPFIKSFGVMGSV
ncbi:MAG: SCP-2 sterol transfer family protein [Proteobacteria bacterium]|nr:SCP-2 sterol transfer family protein [Pseudomonadota bacterium]